jgi:preprotein translocase subunit YajC
MNTTMTLILLCIIVIEYVFLLVHKRKRKQATRKTNGAIQPKEADRSAV